MSPFECVAISDAIFLIGEAFIAGFIRYAIFHSANRV